MEKIDLKKHKELFKILPEHEYKSLERALEKGLYLTPQGIDGKICNEKLEKALPSLYKKFKKIETTEEFLHSPRSYMICSGASLTIGLFVLPVVIPLLFGETPFAVANENVQIITAIIGATTAMSPVFSSFILESEMYRKRKIPKQKKKLSKKILKITGSTLGYKEKWLRKQEKELLKMLDTKESQEFVNAYNEVEKRVAPLHKLELHKKIEKNLYKEWKEGKNLKKTTEKICKTKNAGVMLESLEEELKQEITKKLNNHKKETRKLKGMLEKIQK